MIGRCNFVGTVDRDLEVPAGTIARCYTPWEGVLTLLYLMVSCLVNHPVCIGLIVLYKVYALST